VRARTHTIYVCIYVLCTYADPHSRQRDLVCYRTHTISDITQFVCTMLYCSVFIMTFVCSCYTKCILFIQYVIKTVLQINMIFHCIWMDFLQQYSKYNYPLYKCSLNVEGYCISLDLILILAVIVSGCHICECQKPVQVMVYNGFL
jgi:hypothetical protein